MSAIMNKEYQICTRCVMDTSAPDIKFNADGVCNFCSDFIEKHSHSLFANEEDRNQLRDELIAKVKNAGKGKPYDCIIGLSGGVDSSWAIYLAVKYGLRPLAVHMDNGWDTELAANNIHNLVSRLGVDLYTHVIDWDEYRNLMQAFFDANVLDVELLYDNAMLGVNYHQAAKYGLKYILAGTNNATEGMAMPDGWNWFKLDRKNMSSIWKRFGDGKRIKSFPAIGSKGLIWYRYIKGIQWISFLDVFPYNKEEALDVLVAEMGYKPYPYKHYESVFTRFYQGYLLPKKFGVDKRRLHLSTLIMSRQMEREDALQMLGGIPYPSEKDMEEDIQYFLKKMKWTPEMLDEYLRRPEKPHAMYGSEKGFYDFATNVYRKLGLGKKRAVIQQSER
jgi:N-acetyl sugar amidotransferase